MGRVEFVMETEEDAASTTASSVESSPHSDSDGSADDVTASPPENGDNDDDNVMCGTVTETTEISKAVTWPPSQTASGFKAAAASRYLKLVDASNEESPHSQYTLSRELFKPGKLNEERWKETTEGDRPPNEEVKGGARRGFRKLDDFLHSDEKGPTKMPSYHVPPGTTRTRKAQENYQKHLEGP